MNPQKIESFKIDHNKLKEGIYISRTDGDIVTYDLRTRKPNMGDYMDNITMHSVEHMIATYIRSSEISDSVKKADIIQHMTSLIAEKGEYTGTREARKHIAWYIKGKVGSAQLRDEVNRAETTEAVLEVVEKAFGNRDI